MSSHTHRAPRRRSVRLRALLSMGLVATLGATGTFAFWTDDVQISGATFTAGTLDLTVNNADPYATTNLSMTNMTPGSSVAEVLTFRNAGTAPLKYTVRGILGGPDATDYNTASALVLRITTATTVTGSGNARTCGGTQLVSTPLTTTNAQVLAKRPTTALAATASEALCFQITFADTAPTSLQGKTATATFIATGTSDVS